jgi:CheY-like chemotaxis protein
MNTLSQLYPIERHTLNILIVEDDLDDQILLKIAFDENAEDLSLHFEGTAQQAMDYLQHTPDQQLPHLIVTDYNLPKYNGFKLIQQLNTIERYQGIKKVILSNLLFFPGVENTKKHVVKCFAKPDSFGQMKQLVAQLLLLCPSKENVST